MRANRGAAGRGEVIAKSPASVTAWYAASASGATAPQLAMLEQQYFERKILETSKLPRLSLFYLR